jgi:flavorubredoxin
VIYDIARAAHRLTKYPGHGWLEDAMGLFNQSEIKIIEGLTNIYLLKNPSCAFLVDTGFTKSAPRVANFLQDNNVGFGDLKLIIITHSHHDHVGSLAEVKEQSGAKVLVHQIVDNDQAIP